MEILQASEFGKIQKYWKAFLHFIVSLSFSFIARMLDGGGIEQAEMIPIAYALMYMLLAQLQLNSNEGIDGVSDIYFMMNYLQKLCM